MNENYNGPIYVDEDGRVCTLSYMTDLVNYQAKNDPSIAEDLKDESPEEYWDDIISWGDNTGAAIGFKKYDSMEDYIKTTATKVIKTATNAGEVYVKITGDDTFMASFIADPQELSELEDNINDEARHTAIFYTADKNGIAIDDSIMTDSGDVKYIVNFDIDNGQIDTNYDADIEDYCGKTDHKSIKRESQLKESIDWNDDSDVDNYAQKILPKIIIDSTSAKDCEIEKCDDDNTYCVSFQIDVSDNTAYANIAKACRKYKAVTIANYIDDDDPDIIVVFVIDGNKI